MIFMGRFRCWLIRKRGGKHDYPSSLIPVPPMCARCGNIKRVRKPKLAGA